MSTTIAANNTYDKDKTFDEIIRFLQFGITFTASFTYLVERAMRLPAVIANSEAVLEVTHGYITTAMKYLDILSYAVTFSVFIDPLFREQGSILCITFDGNSQTVRAWVTGGIIAGTVILMIVVYAYGRQGIKKYKAAWQKQIDFVSNALVFMYGVFQLVMVIKDWEYYKKQKLFCISSIIVNLSAIVEMPGVDRKLYEAEKRGLVYGGVYVSRSIAKFTQSFGIMTAER